MPANKPSQTDGSLSIALIDPMPAQNIYDFGQRVSEESIFIQVLLHKGVGLGMIEIESLQKGKPAKTTCQRGCVRAVLDIKSTSTLG
jgi:hypothetical protein